jgi:hypothetical protein
MGSHPLRRNRCLPFQSSFPPDVSVPKLDARQPRAGNPPDATRPAVHSADLWNIVPPNGDSAARFNVYTFDSDFVD